VAHKPEKRHVYGRVIRISKQTGCHTGGWPFFAAIWFRRAPNVFGSLTSSHLVLPRVFDDRPRVEGASGAPTEFPTADRTGSTNTVTRLTSVYAAVSTRNCHYDRFDYAQCYQRTRRFCYCNPFCERKQCDKSLQAGLLRACAGYVIDHMIDRPAQML